MVPAQSQQELPQLLEKVGANEKQLLESLPSVSADESIVQEQLDKHGWARGAPVFTGHYNYLIRAHTLADRGRFSEGRSDANWRSVAPDLPSGFSLVGGFALYPLHFHPFHQDASNFRCLGRQVLDSRNDYVVAFTQQPQKAELVGTVRLNGSEQSVAFQGIAWIDPENFQILRMRIEWLKPRPELGIATIEAQYSEVHLPVVAKSFWLPHEAVITRSARDGALREKHEFSDYKIFVQQKTPATDQPAAARPN